MTLLERDLFDLVNTGIKIPYPQDITNFLETYCEDEIYELANEYPDKNSFYIKHKDICIFSEGLRQAFENHFFKIEPIIKQALAEARALKYREDIDELIESIKIRVSCVFGALKQPIRDLGKKDIGKLVCVDGYARLVSDTDPKSIYTAFECMRCGHINIVYHNGEKFQEPRICESDTCGKNGPFVEDIDNSGWVDYQRIQIQELPDSTIGTKAQDIIVECEEDLTNKIKPGDRITVVGILKLKPKYANGSRKTINEKTIYALSIEKTDLGFEDYVITQSDEEKILELSKDPEILDKIINSVAPSIYGYRDIKEAIAVHLFSGVKKFLPDGSTQRGVIHIGLIGDPGGAKTQLLRRSTQISPRGVFTSGRTASAAGLTAATVKDPMNEGSWMLEGGAAVMASGGTLAVDEIGQARDEDKSALHEVMEQGTVSVAKAGSVTTLKADCGLLIAGNPDTGFFDKNISFADQINIPPALWSRIDLLFIVLDNPNPQLDTEIANHILRNHRIGGMMQNRAHSKNPIFTDAEILEAKNEIEAPISEELLRMYIAYARMYIFPVTSKEVSGYITDFYVNVRKMKLNDPSNPVPITARSVEAVQRIAEAHARMRLSEFVTKEDVDAAKRIIAVSLKDVGMNEEGVLDASIVYSGKSKSQHDKIRWLMDITGSGNKEYQIIYDMKKHHNVNESEVKSILKELCKSGKMLKIKDEYKNVQL